MNVQRTAFISCLAVLALLGAWRFSALAQNAAATAAPAPAATVHIKSFAYAPTPLTVTTGDTVLFVNDDPVAHTVTSTESGQFDSGNLDQNAKWRRTFTKAGTYTYLCTYHTYMKGSVVVKDAQ